MKTNNEFKIKILKRIILSLSFILLNVIVFADVNSPEIEMADAMRSSGKIYVVIAVIAIIFIGIVFFLFRMENRISNIEKNIGENKK